MEPAEGWDPYGRPARRTQWLVSALAYHYGLDRGVENEIVVLATGLDQYLQEIFHHLVCDGSGRIPGEDFRTLCQVLGLEEAAEPEECTGLWDGLSAELTFRQFHARLCGHFSTRAGPRLPLGRESEHIETQIRLRSPRRRRRTDPAGRGAAGSVKRRPPGPCSQECCEEIVALERAEDRIATLEEENGSLRELVEDMRAALQSSDARCLALQQGRDCFLLSVFGTGQVALVADQFYGIEKKPNQQSTIQPLSVFIKTHQFLPALCSWSLQVGLRKSHASHTGEGPCFIGRKRPLTQKHSQTKCLQDVLEEMELMRSSRDGQIEEAIRFSQELEKELKSSQEALVSLEDCNRNLKREQAEMRRKVEEARHAVLNSLGKVKELEVRTKEVPHLQILSGRQSRGSAWEGTNHPGALTATWA
ncbi:EF-hand and coiled-coil domain-containing protein 1-like [Agelaius phoeniceus]|uniref:EF-hand and coiled-coil domain-containing protein 1-like n=1 Tax=Agelaius phoeniceus TaxID=39638 RepID=UPI0040551CE6